ncbi:MAG TPA: CsbD family protein [Polyangiaceae bacterium]|nr:CsbD family protein [Polyangiaceae bacterium]
MSNESNRDEGAARELGGKIKKGIGNLLGDDKMAAEGKLREVEGATQKEEAKAAERDKGEMQALGGAIKNRVGQILGNDKMAAEGKVKELEGEQRQKRNR